MSSYQCYYGYSCSSKGIQWQNIEMFFNVWSMCTDPFSFHKSNSISPTQEKNQISVFA